MGFQSFFIHLSWHNYRISNQNFHTQKQPRFSNGIFYVYLHKMLNAKANNKHLCSHTLTSQTFRHGILFLSSCKTKAQKAHFTSLQTELQPLLSFIQ